MSSTSLSKIIEAKNAQLLVSLKPLVEQLHQVGDAAAQVEGAVANAAAAAEAATQAALTTATVLEQIQNNYATHGLTTIREFVFPTPRLLWAINHNRNTTRFKETLIDADGERFIAQVSIIDSNTFHVLLTEAISGRVEVVFDEAGLSPVIVTE